MTKIRASGYSLVTLITLVAGMLHDAQTRGLRWLILYPRWDSNPQHKDFKSSASAIGLLGPAHRDDGIRAGFEAHKPAYLSGAGAQKPEHVLPADKPR